MNHQEQVQRSKHFRKFEPQCFKDAPQVEIEPLVLHTSRGKETRLDYKEPGDKVQSRQIFNSIKDSEDWNKTMNFTAEEERWFKKEQESQDYMRECLDKKWRGIAGVKKEFDFSDKMWMLVGGIAILYIISLFV
jgi:hypothetical protein